MNYFIGLLILFVIIFVMSIIVYRSNKKQEESNLMLIFIIFAVDLIIILPTTLYILIRVFSNYLWPDINNTLVYYGTITGSSLTGFITAVGLFFTLNQNANELQKQRAFDEKARKEEKVNFEKQYNILIINEKLKLYEELFMLRLEIQKFISKIEPKDSYNTHSSFLENLFGLVDKLEFLGGQLSSNNLYSRYKIIISKFYQFKKLYDSNKKIEERVRVHQLLCKLLVEFSDELLQESRKESEKKFK